MHNYLTLFSFTSDSWPEWRGQAQEHEDGVRLVIEALGGRMHAFHWTLGDHDGLAIYSVPGEAAAAAASAGISAVEGVAHLCTTALLDSSEIGAAADSAIPTSAPAWVGPARGRRPTPSTARD